MIRGVATVAVAAALVLTACSRDRDGLIDLDEVSTTDFPVTAEVEVAADGCDLERVALGAGELVALTAAADDVAAFEGDGGLSTGQMLDGEQVRWRFAEEGTSEITCEGPDGTSEMVIEVGPAAPLP